jgi:hypothetical protein
MKTFLSLLLFAALCVGSDAPRDTDAGPATVGCKAFVVYVWKDGTNRRIESYNMARCEDAEPKGGMMAIRYLVDASISHVWAIRYIPIHDIESVTVQKTE